MRHLTSCLMQFRGTTVLFAVVLCVLCLPAASRESVSSAVVVTTDKSAYDQGEMIEVTITNTSSAPIYALTGQTYCTIVSLQRNVDGAWKPEGPCQSYAPPGWVKIAAGATSRVQVKAGLPADQPLAAGRYQAKLTFNVGSTSGRPASTVSSEFLINVARSR